MRSGFYSTAAIESEESSSHTGMIIGIMTSIIVALVGTIVAMSVRNRKQNGGRYIMPTTFGGITLKVIRTIIH